MVKKIAVLGGGAFGVALARRAAFRSEHVSLYARDEELCRFINQHHRHPAKLPSIVLPKNIQADSSLPTCIESADFIINALPMSAISSVFSAMAPHMNAQSVLVNTTKGIEQKSLNLTCDATKLYLPRENYEHSCYLSGPSFALELAADLPTALTLASFDKRSAISFQKAFSGDTLRLYSTTDVVGVCVGGAAKNVIAIAAGVCVGLGLGRNALSSLITRGLAEMSRLAICLGGRRETLSGLSGVGDLILSCTDEMSRNHRLGLLLADNKSLAGALNEIGSVVEGANTVKAVVALAKKFAIDLPISTAVNGVLYENLDPQKAISSLLNRKLKDEID